jgi:hypothetical protein
MKTLSLRVPGAVGALALLISAPIAHAGDFESSRLDLQDKEHNRAKLTFEANAFGTVSASGSLDGGGTARVNRAGFSFDSQIPVADQWRVNLRLENEYSFYNFSGSNALGGKPFDTLNLVRLIPSATWNSKDGWIVSFGTILDYAGESGANAGDSLQAGGFVTVRRHLSKDLIVGIGVSAQGRFEDHTRLLPIFAIDWRVNDSLRIFSNRLGLHVEEQLAPDWFMTFRARFEPREYRLDNSPSAVVPGGVGRDESVLLGLEISWRPNDLVKASIEVGGIVYQKFELLSAGGNELFDANTNPTPYIGGSLSLNF